MKMRTLAALLSLPHVVFWLVGTPWTPGWIIIRYVAGAMAGIGMPMSWHYSREDNLKQNDDRA